VKPYGLPPDAQITVAFIGDAEMRELNRRYRSKDRTTDVLSFGQAVGRSKGERAVTKLARDADGELDVGDIVISAAQAARQARRRKHPLVREIAFLAAHGALHLLGFEDETPAGYREMVRLGTAATGKGVAASRG
jgi:probable rRNA maturation factor